MPYSVGNEFTLPFSRSSMIGWLSIGLARRSQYRFPALSQAGMQHNPVSEGITTALPTAGKGSGLRHTTCFKDRH